MASDVKLPRLGQGMESGFIVKWLKAEGDRVDKGDPLFEVDTDKATQEVEAEASGVLLKIAVAEGDVPVGVTVAFIGEPGEEISIAAPPVVSPPAVTTEIAGEDGEVDEPPIEDPGFRDAINGARDAVGAGRIKASPLARRIARETGVDLALVRGTGPDGRIVAVDVERGPEAVEPGAGTVTSSVPAVPTTVSAPSADVDVQALTTVRKTIARRLTAAWQVPAFQLTVSIDMTNANDLVERSRELNPDVRVTVTDLLVKVCAQALVRHREVNAQYTDEAIHVFPTANVGIAVAAPQGLVVPVITSAERLSLVEVAGRRIDLVGRSREGKLALADFEGGTFTISNLGMFGIEQFTAVLNPPQAAILAVGATVDRPVALDGQVVIRPMMSVTLTVDHRAVDGGPAAQFLGTVKTFLEDPALAL